MNVVEVPTICHNGCHVVTHRPKKLTATFVAFLCHNRTCPNVMTREVLRREAANPIKSHDVVSLNLRKLTRSFGLCGRTGILGSCALRGGSQEASRAWSQHSAMSHIISLSVKSEWPLHKKGFPGECSDWASWPGSWRADCGLSRPAGIASSFGSTACLKRAFCRALKSAAPARSSPANGFSRTKCPWLVQRFSGAS